MGCERYRVSSARDLRAPHPLPLPSLTAPAASAPHRGVAAMTEATTAFFMSVKRLNRGV